MVKTMTGAKRKDRNGVNLEKGEYQDKTGRYSYKYMNNDGKRVTIYNTELKKLREMKKAIEKDLDDNIDAEGKTKTVNTLILNYLATKPKLADSTRENYLYIYHKDIEKSTLGKKRVCDIVKSDMKRFYTSLSNNGYKDGTIKLYQNLLYPAFELAIDDNLIRKNPCSGVMKEYCNDDKIEKQALTLSEQKRLLNFIRNNSFYSHYYPMIVFMLLTGCRVGEVIGLTWNDVSMRNRIININHQLVYKKVNGVTKFRAVKPKTKTGVRDIPMMEETHQALQEQREIQMKLGVDREIEVEGYLGFIFTTAEGRPMQPNSVNRFIDNIVKTHNKHESEKAKRERREPELLPHLSAHSMRHTFCSQMAENGMDIKVLQRIMGHSNITVTMNVYNHTNKDRITNEMERIGKMYKIG